jgi:hypothetical protein
VLIFVVASFFDPCSEKNIKKIMKKIKSLIPTGAFWKI